MAASTKEQALAEIRRIVEAHQLDAGDLRALAAAIQPGRPRRTPSPVDRIRHAGLGSIVLRVFYYLGGTLVFAGLGIYIQTVWQDLTSLQRVLVTLGPGFVAYLLGIIFARNPDLEKAATPAHLVAFVMQPTGLFVLLDEFFEGDDAALGAMVVFGPLAIQQLLTFISLRRASLLLFTLLFTYGFAGAATAYFDLDFGVSAIGCGWFLYVLSADMHRKEAYRELTPLFFTLGSGLMLAGLWYHVGGTIYEPLALSLSFGFLLHAVLTGSRTLYVVSLLCCEAMARGPSSVFASRGSPIRMVRARSTTRSTVSSKTSRCTKTRLPATQVWPPAAKMPATIPMDAEAMSASGKTMLGDFPPSSRVALMKRSPQVRAITAPVAVLPVNDTFWTRAVCDQGAAGFCTEAGHDVDHTGREAGPVEQLDELEQRGGGVLGGLDDHGVAGGKGGSELRGGEHQR